MTPRTPVAVRPFPGQIVIPLVKRLAYMEEDGQIEVLIRPDCAPVYDRIYGEIGTRFDVSSAVDVWRPWMSSYRAAQRKSNASLPGESPHFFGLSFDVDLRLMRSALKTSDRGVRGLLASLGAFPHPNMEREPWHHDMVQCHPGGYRRVFRELFPALEQWGCYGTSVGEATLWQSALAAIDDPQTGQPYYGGKIDGRWGPKSEAAYRALACDWKAAWIRSRGRQDWQLSVMGGQTPGDRGRWILATISARFEVIP